MIRRSPQGAALHDRAVPGPAGDAFDRPFRPGELVRGPVEAQAPDGVARRLARDSPVDPVEVAGREAGDLRQRIEGQVFVQVVGDVGHHPGHPAAVVNPRRGLGLWHGSLRSQTLGRAD